MPQHCFENATIVSIDIDVNELQKHSDIIDLPICVDALKFIQILLEKASSSYDFLEWLTTCQSWKSRYPLEYCSDSSNTFISHYEFVDFLSTHIPDDYLIATGSSGLAIEVFYSTFRSRPGQRIFLTSGLGSMGYGLPSAIGACFGSNQMPTIALESDGSLMLNIQELATVSGYHLPIKLIIMDNGGYSSIRNTQKNYFESRFVSVDNNSGLFIPDLLRVCSSFDLESFECNTLLSLHELLPTFLSSPGPSALIVKLCKEETLLPKVTAIPHEDGSITSMPLEDMSPLLDLSILQKEMLFPLKPASYAARNLPDPN